MIQQPTPWSCYPTAISILTGISIETLHKFLGHDGSTIVDDKPDPAGRETFTYSHMAMVLLDLGWSSTFIYAAIEKAPHYPSWESIQEKYKNDKYVICVQKRDYDHCLAYDHGIVYEPITGLQTTLTPQHLVKSIEVLRCFSKAWQLPNLSESHSAQDFDEVKQAIMNGFRFLDKPDSKDMEVDLSANYPYYSEPYIAAVAIRRALWSENRVKELEYEVENYEAMKARIADLEADFWLNASKY